jgi:opacity protein-like surface antigen
MTLKNLLLTGSIALALAGAASASQAAVVTIDFSGHGSGGAIGNTYAAQGVTFSPNAKFGLCTGGCPAPNPDGNFAYVNAYGSAGNFSVNFASAQSDVSFQSVSYSSTHAFAYDAVNNLVDEIADDEGFPISEAINHLTGAGITRIDFEYNGGFVAPAITNLTFNGVAVPEPATWAMMLTGFFGLGSMLRRRRVLDAVA